MAKEKTVCEEKLQMRCSSTVVCLFILLERISTTRIKPNFSSLLKIVLGNSPRRSRAGKTYGSCSFPGLDCYVS